MKTKQKVLIVVIVAVMALAIIGLAVGLVLVAQRANTSGFMTVTYIAKEVDCEITAQGVIVDGENRTDLTAKIQDSNNTDLSDTSIVHRAGQSASSNKFVFDNVDLPDPNNGTGYVAYMYVIKDTTPDSNPKSSKSLGVKLSVINANIESNVEVLIGQESSEDPSVVYDNADYKNVKTAFANLGTYPGSDHTTFVVRLSVADATKNVDSFQLQIRFDIEYIDYSDTVSSWGNDSDLTAFNASLTSANTLINSDSINSTTVMPVIEIDSPEKLCALAYFVNEYQGAIIDSPAGNYTNYNPFTRVTHDNGYTVKHVTFKLTKDIDLAGVDFDPIGYGYNDINNADNVERPFSGIFDGNGHTIYNMNINKNSEWFGGDPTIGTGSAGVGLFGFVRCGIIQNLTIEGATVVGNRYVGGIVGYLYNSCNNGWDSAELIRRYASIVTNCTITNSEINCIYNNTEDSGDKAGTLVGFSCMGFIENSTATNCCVNSGRDAGQLLGCWANGGRSGLPTECSVSSYYVPDTNTATNVTVSANGTGTGKNINNTFVGRS